VRHYILVLQIFWQYAIYFFALASPRLVLLIYNSSSSILDGGTTSRQY
jgi:hypothetical protein